MIAIQNSVLSRFSTYYYILFKLMIAIQTHTLLNANIHLWPFYIKCNYKKDLKQFLTETNRI